jgi:NADH dehydrogenase FAD-containing subunit
MGVKVVQGEVVAVDAAGKKVRLAGGPSCPTTA